MWLKIIFLVYLPYVLCLSEEMKELAKMLHTNCQEETGVPEEMITNTQKGEFADDERFKCYIKCVLVQMASMNDEGMIDVETTISLLPDEIKDKVADTIKACGTVVGKNHCENAWLTHKCYYEKNPENYFLV